MPRGLTLLIDDNHFPTSPTLTLQNSNLQCFSVSIVFFFACVRWLTVRCWHFLPEFAHFDNEVIIEIIGNIKWFCDESAIWFDESCVGPMLSQGGLLPWRDVAISIAAVIAGCDHARGGTCQRTDWNSGRHQHLDLIMCETERDKGRNSVCVSACLDSPT